MHCKYKVLSAFKVVLLAGCLVLSSGRRAELVRPRVLGTNYRHACIALACTAAHMSGKLDWTTNPQVKTGRGAVGSNLRLRDYMPEYPGCCLQPVHSNTLCAACALHMPWGLAVPTLNTVVMMSTAL